MSGQPQSIEVRSCGLLVYRAEPRRSFLLMRHADRWDLPKGHIDLPESELDCALRELHEETGIEPAAIEVDPLFRFTHRYVVRRDRHRDQSKLKELIVFLGLLIRPAKIRVSEHEGYRWFPWDPPHRIQKNTIDPLLAAVGQHWKD